MTDQAIALLAPRIGTRAACRAAGVAQASWYRRHRASPAPPRPVPVPHGDWPQPRALSPAERAAILDALHCPRFADLAPAEVWAILRDEGTYLGSQSTFYRLLRAAGETRERRRQAVHPAAVKPELAAADPNQVWSWGHHQAARPGEVDLPPPLRHPRHLLPLRLPLDGRHPRVRRPGREAHRRHVRQAGHRPRAADRPRRPRLLNHLPAGRVPARRPLRTQSRSRPHVSNGNPFSEAQFNTQTGRTSPPGSPRSSTPGRTARNSSAGTTTSTGTAAWACTQRPTSTTGTPQSSRPSEPRS